MGRKSTLDPQIDASLNSFNVVLRGIDLLTINCTTAQIRKIISHLQGKENTTLKSGQTVSIYFGKGKKRIVKVKIVDVVEEGIRVKRPAGTFKIVPFDMIVEE